jgi:hypothetical protein
MVTVPGGIVPGVTAMPGVVIGMSPSIGPSVTAIPAAGGQDAGSGLLRWNSIGLAVPLHPPAPIKPAVTTSPVPHLRPIWLTSLRDPATATTRHADFPRAQDSLKKAFPRSRQHTNHCAQKTRPTGEGWWAWETSSVANGQPAFLVGN